MIDDFAYGTVPGARYAPGDGYVAQNDFEPIVSETEKALPRIGRAMRQAVIKRGQGQGYMEFYPPWESHNPHPGKVTLEVRNGKLSGDELRGMLQAEMLHYLGALDPRSGKPVDPEFRALKERFSKTFSQDQQQINQHAFEMDRKAFPNDKRTFDDWMDQSRTDAYLRALLFPEVNPEWKSMPWSDQQRSLGDQMRQLLSR